jgi:hypothetical protein
MKTTRAALVSSLTGVVCAGLLVVPQAGAEPTGLERAVAGARTAGDTLFPHQGNGGYDVGHYDIDLAYAADGTIAATTTIEATVTATEALSEFSLDLEGLTVSAVTVDGAEAAHERVVDAEEGIHKLVVTPAAPVTGTFTTAVTYAGTPTAHTDPDGSMEGWTQTAGGNVVALNEPVGSMTWFPNNNTPRDKATFTTALTVPYLPLVPAVNRTAVSTGVLDSVTETASTRTFTWEQPNQQATYLSLVSIGVFTEGLSNVALTEGTTPEWSYANTLLAGPSGFEQRRGQLSEMLQAIERSYGTYPGAATGLVVDNSTLGYALETQDRPYFENTIGQNILLHELAHQWFGNAVSPTDWSDIWLNEGPATFIPIQVEAELYDGPSTEDFFHGEWARRAAGNPFWARPIAGFTDAEGLFAGPNYDRGAMTLEAMRTALGDAVFTEIMSTWIERYAGEDASTAEWIALSEEISGFDLTAFFQDWLYDADKPAWPSRWSLDLTSSPASGATLDAGDPFSVTLTAVNQGKVNQSGSVVTVDAASLLAQADLGPLPAGVTRTGSTLMWTVPDNGLADAESVTVPATVKQTATSDPIVLRARAATLGATCGTCTTTLRVDGRDAPVAQGPRKRPRIEGTARVGRTLRAVVGPRHPASTTTLQWLADDRPVRGETRRRLVLTRALVGERLRLRATTTRPGFLPLVLQSKQTRPVRPRR